MHAYFRLTILTLLFHAPFTLAANLAISPTSITLHPKKDTASLTFTNRDAKPVTLQLFLKTWHQDEVGKTLLSDSRDVVVFPKMLKIEPGQERPIRVGFRGQWPEIERSFRVFADELPQIDVEEGTTGVVFPVRLSIPLFVRDQAENVDPKIEIEAIQTHQGQLRIGIRNHARQHVAIIKILAQLSRANGQSLTELEDVGGRILAHGKVFFDIPLEAQTCRQVHRAALTLTMGQATHEQTLDLSARDCP